MSPVVELPTTLPGVRLFRRQANLDNRGSFRRVYSEDEYIAAGLRESFVEDNVSISRRNVLRGLHYDFRLAKFVQVLKGEIFDVVADVRRSSPAFGRWEGFRLTAQGCEQLYVPRGFAHGFYVLSEDAIVSYKQSDTYDPATEGQVRWNDPDLAVAWPLLGEPILSAKDSAAGPLSALPPMA